MRIWRFDGVEQVDIPKGVLIARDGKSTPSCPPNFPHKVEYLETNLTNPTWVMICCNQRNYLQELADILHAKLCRWNHTDGCGWGYHSWDKIPLDDDRAAYLKKATSMLRTAQTVCKSEERAFNLCMDMMKDL